MKRKIELKISTKVALSFIILVLLQGLIYGIALTAIISSTQNDSFQTQMNRAFLGIEGYLRETLNALTVNTDLLTGQKKVIDYTDFGLKNLLKRELAVFKSMLQIDSLSIYLSPTLLFTSEGDILVMKDNLKNYLESAFTGQKAFFISESGRDIKLTALSPIRREDKIIGVLSLSLKLDRLFVKKLENISNSKIIIHFKKIAVDAGDLNPALVTEIISAAGKKSLARDFARINGFLVGSIPMESIKEPGGAIFCLLDTKESTRLLTRYNTISLIFTFLILSLAFFTGIIFYRVIFFRPFQNLLKGVHMVAEGDLNYNFQVPAEDEFGELASAFNKMRVNLLNREKELLQLSHYNNLVLENVPSGIITVNLNSEITTYNPAAEKTIGLKAKDLKGIHIGSGELPRQLFALIGESADHGLHFSGKEVRIVQAGNDTILSLSTSPLLSEDGTKIGTIAIFEDISLVKKLEEKLHISSRLAALGEMAAGVAHQIRNPLGVMKVSAEMLRDNFQVIGKSENYSRITHMMISEIDTLNLVISNLLDFARPKAIQRTLYSIEEVLRSSLESLPLDKYPDLGVETIVQEGIPPYLMDKSLIEQVISNLILNAIQASPPNSRIEIRVFMKNNVLNLEIQDWGCGFDEATRKQIFNPFFTTKTAGMGLGLSIAHRIVEQHNGTIDVFSMPGKGSTFRVEF
ncbi:MAG: ATP-binding protein [Spirochaetota bacterium]